MKKLKKQYQIAHLLIFSRKYLDIRFGYVVPPNKSHFVLDIERLPLLVI